MAPSKNAILPRLVRTASVRGHRVARNPQGETHKERGKTKQKNAKEVELIQEQKLKLVLLAKEQGVLPEYRELFWEIFKLKPFAQTVREKVRLLVKNVLHVVVMA